MDHAHAMGGLQRPADLFDERYCFLWRELRPLMEDVGEIFALNILHGDELYPLSLAEVVNTDDVAVGNLSGEDQFLLEAVEDSAVAGQVGANHFKRDHAPELDIPGFVNGAHATFAEQAQPSVAVGQQVAGSQIRLSWLGVRTRQGG